MSSSSTSTFNSNKQPAHAAHHGMRRKRSLNFCGTVAVKLIPTLNEMTDAEYFGVYYTDVEFQALRRSTMDDVMEMRDLCSGWAGRWATGEMVCIDREGMVINCAVASQEENEGTAIAVYLFALQIFLPIGNIVREN